MDFALYIPVVLLTQEMLVQVSQKKMLSILLLQLYEYHEEISLN